jgi:hypothetical protein
MPSTSTLTPMVSRFSWSTRTSGPTDPRIKRMAASFAPMVASAREPRQRAPPST